MPHLRFRALELDVVKELSALLPKQLATLMQTGEDNFTFEAISSQFVEAGKCVGSYPFVEVLWFDRGQAVKDRVAAEITEKILGLTSTKDVVVIFIALPRESYYENGKHF